MLVDHVDGILNHGLIKIRMGVAEAVNENIKTLLRRGRGYQNLKRPAAQSKTHRRREGGIGGRQ